MTSIRWTPSALEDLERIRLYLLERADADAMRSESERIWRATLRLRHFPASGRPGRIPNTREIVVSPYVLPYRVRGDAVEILAVFHQAMDRP